MSAVFEIALLVLCVQIGINIGLLIIARSHRHRIEKLEGRR